MNQAISPEIREIMGVVHYRPAVSIMMPFEPKMSARAELAQQLKRAADHVQKEIRQNYRDDLAELVIQKLNTIIKELNFNTYKKSIAVFVSPVFEKVLYLDIPVEEKVIIDESFEIRDLVYAKKEIHKYLVVLLSSKNCKVFIGNTNTFIKIRSNVHTHSAGDMNDAPERVSNFSDPGDRKETILHKFLQETDQGLTFLLHTYQLPVFVMATPKLAGHFKALTKNGKSIMEYVHGNYENATETELKGILQPYVNDWKKVKSKDLQCRMEEAADTGTLARGIREVWKQASHRNGRLLIVEKNFMYAAEHGSQEDVIYKAIAPYNKFSYIRDAVDDIIEKVLEAGGDVEFVDPDMLNAYQHIALVQYHN